MSKRVMKLLDSSTGFMECRVCGTEHTAMLAPGGRYRRGSWQCVNKCALPDRRSRPIRKTLRLPFDFERPRPGEGRPDYTGRLLASLHEQLDYEVEMADGDWGAAMVEEVASEVAEGAGWTAADQAA